MSKGHRDWISADEIEILTFGSDKVCTGAVKVRVDGTPSIPDDAWVQVIGTWRPQPISAPGSEELPVLVVGDLARIAPPEDPYGWAVVT